MRSDKVDKLSSVAVETDDTECCCCIINKLSLVKEGALLS